jgi:hypothetical protein
MQAFGLLDYKVICNRKDGLSAHFSFDSAVDRKRFRISRNH